ncbi:MAG: DUF1956 domain-containing protein [Opitutales bacterium]|nr:DUF1956 domain-containing protein [Opitutales bacterium]
MIKRNIVAELSQGKCADAKSKILKSALEEFSMLPFSAVRTRQIASNAGVNHAAISYYFGGKKELYLETVRQISEYIHLYIAEFFARASEVKRAKSIEQAKALIHDFTMSRVCIDSENNVFFRNIISIIMREEMYPTEAFDIIYEKVIEPSVALLVDMLKIASSGKCKGVEAQILAQMLLGQVMLFNSTKSGFKRISGWKTFGSKEYSKIDYVQSRILQKIFT